MPTVDDVRTVAQAIRQRSGHEFRADDDYISRPKSDGYRSHHLKLNFNGTRTQNHNGRRIEIQVRTRLRHSWATAVEAVGMFRGEHLKSHQGSDAWLRLFTLMSAEFALSEGCPVPPNVPDQATRILEIKALDKELKAIDTLENLSQAVRWTEEYVQPDDVVPKYYLIRYDNKTI